MDKEKRIFFFRLFTTLIPPLRANDDIYHEFTKNAKSNKYTAHRKDRRYHFATI